MSATVLTASNFSELENDIGSVDAANSDTLTISFTGNITETSDLDAINLHTGVSLVIEAGGHTLSDGGSYRGLFVYNGNVAVDQLTITNAAAIGGAEGAANPTSFASTGQISNTCSGSVALRGPSGTNGTLTNSGTITETASGGIGISFALAGTVTDTGFGLITSADNGIELAGGGVISDQYRTIDEGRDHRRTRPVAGIRPPSVRRCEHAVACHDRAGYEAIGSGSHSR